MTERSFIEDRKYSMMRNINKHSYLWILDPSQTAMQFNPLRGHSLFYCSQLDT